MGEHTKGSSSDSDGDIPSYDTSEAPRQGVKSSYQSDASKSGSAWRVWREVTRPGEGLVHPALIPGIGVEQTKRSFSTNKAVFGIAGVLIVLLIVWALYDPGGVISFGDSAHAWVTSQMGWLFSMLAILAAVYMLVLGYSRLGGIRLGADDEKPEFSTFSWIAMLFSAGVGIGLVFYGPYEPLVYYTDPPRGFGVDPETGEALKMALSQAMLHWGPVAWSMYALSGAAIAYGSYRRGRPALISAIFEPLLGQHTQGIVGTLIDTFAILVTLFGTTVSLGLGALQIASGVEKVGALDYTLGNPFLVAIMVVLTALFIISAVSGVKRGIRILSNLNMVIAGLLAVFVLLTGPTVYLLDLIPATSVQFFGNLPAMLGRIPADGPDMVEFLSSWTLNYWAWWVSWIPYVGTFIAKVSRGRTLRQYVTIVIGMPTLVCFLWFVIFGGTAIDMGLDVSSNPQSLLFALLSNLPFSTITAVLAVASITVFFVTSADSASIIMSSMTQRGKPEPAPRVTITWGVLLGLTAMSLLLAGGDSASDELDAIQNIMVIAAVPFIFIVFGIMVAFGKDLNTDPYILRRKYAQAAIDQGIRLGIADHGDNFVFGSSKVSAHEGAGAWLDSENPQLREWYTEHAEEVEKVDSDDVRRSLSPEYAQTRQSIRPEHKDTGENTSITQFRYRNDSSDSRE